MKYYLTHLTQHDGEHEHTYSYIAKGRTELAVRRRIETEQLYDVWEKAHPNSMLSYDDGVTAVSKYWLKEIPQEHYNFLYKHNYKAAI